MGVGVGGVAVKVGLGSGAPSYGVGVSLSGMGGMNAPTLTTPRRPGTHRTAITVTTATRIIPRATDLRISRDYAKIARSTRPASGVDTFAPRLGHSPTLREQATLTDQKTPFENRERKRH